MSDPPSNLRVLPVAAPRELEAPVANASIVEMLEAVLARAKAGEITDIVLSAGLADGDVCSAHGGGTLLARVGRLEFLKHYLLTLLAAR